MCHRKLYIYRSYEENARQVVDFDIICSKGRFPVIGTQSRKLMSSSVATRLDTKTLCSATKTSEKIETLDDGNILFSNLDNEQK